MTTTSEGTIEAVGLGWPMTSGDVSRETTLDVSRETAGEFMGRPGDPAGLGWPE